MKPFLKSLVLTAAPAVLVTGSFAATREVRLGYAISVDDPATQPSTQPSTQPATQPHPPRIGPGGMGGGRG